MKQGRNKSNDFRILHDLMIGEIEEEELTKHQAEKLVRVKAIFTMLMNVDSTMTIVDKLKFQYNLSQAQAFRDIQLTEALYGPARKANKDFKRIVAEEMAKETYRMAKDKKDLRAMAAANRNYIEATGCNIDDPDLPDFEKLKPSVNLIVLPPAIQEGLVLRLNAGPVKMNAPEIEALEYEKLNDRTTSPTDQTTGLPTSPDSGGDTKVT